MSKLEFHFTNRPSTSTTLFSKHPRQKSSDRGWEWYGYATVNPNSKDSGFFKPGKRRNKSKKKKLVTKPKDLSVLQYLKTSLDQSAISGLNKITSSKNQYLRLLWVLVLFCCLSGFSFQTLTFANLYWSRPSIVQTEIENDGTAEFPSITVCNTNRIRKSAFCNVYPENCSDFDNGGIDDENVSKILQIFLYNNDTRGRFKMGHLGDTVLRCEFNGFPSMNQTECIESMMYFFDPDFGNCYVFPGMNKDEVILQASEADFWQEENGYSFLLDVQADEFMELKRDPGFFLAPHDRQTYPDVHTDGIILEPGKAYSIGLQKSSQFSLQLPYKSNCTDYEKLLWKRKRKITSRMCTVGCSQYYQMQKCQYVTKQLSMFYMKLPFDPTNVTQEQKDCALRQELDTQNFCRSLCSVPCKDIVYETTVSDNMLTTRETTGLSRGLNISTENTSSLIHVKIYFSSIDHTIYRHTPKYDTMELFSYLGGYSGVWLGFSLLTVYEMFEIIGSTFAFAVHKYRYKIQQKKLVEAILGFNTMAKSGPYRRKLNFN